MRKRALQASHVLERTVGDRASRISGHHHCAYELKKRLQNSRLPTTVDLGIHLSAFRGLWHGSCILPLNRAYCGTP
jgi:hypothetical protein